MKLFFKKKNTSKKKISTVDPEEEARWIHQYCNGRYPIKVIEEILDYEMNYLTTIGVVDLSDEEMESNRQYWNEYWRKHGEQS